MKAPILLLALVTLIAGCGPLVMPMVPRLDEEEQLQVDQVWDNLLTPVHKADHQTLLDVMSMGQMYLAGVDRALIRSEKAFTGGFIVMEIFFDRTNPGADRFEIGVFDPKWRALRRETYSREEVEQTGIDLGQLSSNLDPPIDKEGRPLPETDEQLERRQARVSRARRIEAATQPAH